MSDALPQVGARIKVSRTHQTGATQVFEDSIAAWDEDADGTIEYKFGSGGYLRVPSLDPAWQAVVEIFAPPLPPEPEEGEFVACGGDGNPLPFFRRWSEGWMKVDGKTSEYTTWPEICELSRERWGRMPTRLVAERQLADLFTLRDAAVAWVENISDPVNLWGDDTDRALIDAAILLGAKYAPTVTA